MAVQPVTGSTQGGPRNLALLGLLGLLFGASFPFARLGVQAGANPFILISLDLALAAGTMAILSSTTHGVWPTGRELATSVGIGALLIGGINLPLFWGVQYASGGAAAIVYATAPLVSILAGMILGNRLGLSVRQSAALGLGLLGVVVLVLTSAGTGVLTDSWAIAAFGAGAVCQGTGAVLLARVKPNGESRWGLTFEFLGAAVVAVGFASFLAPHATLPAVPAVFVSIAFLGFGSLVGGYLIFHDLVRRWGPVRANLVTYLNPVVALVIGVAAFREPFQAFELIGLAIILVALLLLQVPIRRPTPRPLGPDVGEATVPAHP